MNVLYVTNMYPTPERPAYGIFVKEQIQALELAGVDATLVSIAGNRSKTEYPRAAVEIHRQTRRGRFDLVHAHYGLSGAVAITQRAAPVVTTFWGSDTFVWWQKQISRVVARLSTPIFVSRQNALRVGMPDATVIPSSIDLGMFGPVGRLEARAALGWEQSQRYALLPGARGNPVKRADLFDAALGAVRRAGTPVHGIALEGFPRSVVPLVMNAVDVLVLTSDSEGSPLAVKEALACGTPVVSVDVGDVAEVISGLAGCSITERGAEALARGIAAALQEPDRDGLRGRAARYSHEQIAAEIIRLYREVTSVA